MPPRESSLKRRIRLWLNEQPHCRVICTTGDGEPDLIGCVRGQFFALEVKSPKAPGATPLQVATLEKWHDAGGYAVVVRSLAEVQRLLSPIGPR